MKKLGLLLTIASLSVGCQRANAVTAPAQEPAVAQAEAVAAGPRAEGQGFIVEVVAPADAPIGATAVARVVLRPTAGYKVNKEFPLALSITAPAGVALDKAKLTAADAAKFADDGASFDVAFTAKDGGDKKFEATFKFAVCTTETCDPKTEKLAWTVVTK